MMTRSASPGWAPGPAATSAEWWRQAVVYQICPHRFADADADSAGDLRGVISRIPYLASLGVDAVWLSPFDPSALADGGYHVDDDHDVHPLLGTLADFDEMTSGLHAHGIKVIVDEPSNHTSNRHPWFTEALAASPGSSATNRSIFRDGLGRSFTFDLLEASWDTGEFLQVITDNLADAQQYGASTTWVLASHGAAQRRARAAALLTLALPGSTYLYQGEELGLHEAAEVADLPVSVEAQEHDPDSTLSLYRQALGWRRKLQAADHLEWMPGTNGQVLHFGRPGGWRSVTNFGPRAVPLPHGTVVLASASLEAGLLPADTTAWIIRGS
jgi:glycosidase